MGRHMIRKISSCQFSILSIDQQMIMRGIEFYQLNLTETSQEHLSSPSLEKSFLHQAKSNL
jgi:hypothetical protein